MSHAIGIFDSGIGGLTVLRAVRQRLPGEDLVYLGDTARVPYGTKSRATVVRYSVQNCRFLLGQGVKAIVVACNTASAFALEALRDQLEVPVVGVIEPGVRGALDKSRSRRIGVIGTEGTVQSRAYSRAILALEPGAQVFEISCPLFVPLVEEGMTEGAIPEQIARHYLTPLLKNKIDTLILGCTHYPLLKKVISGTVGAGVALVDSAEESARAVQGLLRERSLSTPAPSGGLTRAFVTDGPERFRRVGEFFLGGPLADVEQIDL